jgi:hypothetical protein
MNYYSFSVVPQPVPGLDRLYDAPPPPVDIASGFLTFSFLPGCGLLARCPTPKLEDQVSEFISTGDRVAQLYP